MKSEALIQVFGIRHHGPGSARALLEALAQFQPDRIAIELPHDLEETFQYVKTYPFEPPVAIAVFDPTQTERAFLYPFAQFSPEWQAASWAKANAKHLHAIDLPASLSLALSAEEKGKKGSANIQEDPLGEFAKLAGYDDRESWWHHTFEKLNPGAEIFPVILEMIATLRQTHPNSSDRSCLLREKYMAAQLLGIQKKFPKEKIAVVCGAWHAPVLSPTPPLTQQDADKTSVKRTTSPLKETAKGLAAAKKGLKGPKLKSAWIPYTYQNLKKQRGYGAGVDSPIWYELLFTDPQHAPEKYLNLIGKEMREKGLPASTARIVDAIELADSLATIRNLNLPGLPELYQAALSTIADGELVRLNTSIDSLENLAKAGSVDPNLSGLPLQVDLEKQLRSTRLFTPYKTMEEVDRTLDLRKEKHLLASQLLNQLELLNIPYGTLHPGKANAKGTCSEFWKLHWQPSFLLRLLQMHVYGNQVAQAAGNALLTKLDGAGLAQLTAGIEKLIRAGLFVYVDQLAEKIKAESANTQDIWIIAEALPVLLNLLRYKSLRLKDSHHLHTLIHVLLPKFNSGLKEACSNLDEDAAYHGFRLVQQIQHALPFVEDEGLSQQFLQRIEQMAFTKTSHPLLVGWAIRTLFDSQKLSLEACQRELSFHLSTGGMLSSSSYFVEGFLHSSGLILLHQPKLLDVLDDWLSAQTDEEFKSLLPALRRTFSKFAPNERQQIFRKIANRHDEDHYIPSSPGFQGDDFLDATLTSWLD